ncbi:peptide chain release factor aRF-1 [Candidatus Woesearchaeota archaeon]|nr:peptide chain release factor aRF-1 [Candidatus Woesearchaeota archaeon]
MEKLEERRLKKFIRDLENIRGRHTELVSVYVPAGYDIIKIIQHLQQEQGTAENIKDKINRKRVIDSLEKMIRHLKLFKVTPKNGLAVFSGNISDKENVENIQVFSIEPPDPVQTRLYRCDQTFMLDILRNQMEAKHSYGLIVIDNREGTIGLLKGTNITVLAHMTSGVPGKQKAGGQSSTRFARLREEAAHEFYKRIAEISNKTFLEMKNLSGIIIGGPGPTKEIFLDGAYLNNELKKKVLGTKDLSYTGEFGLNELVDKSKDLLEQEAIVKEKKIMTDFFTIFGKEPEKIRLGKEKVLQVIEYGAVDILLLSEDLDDAVIEELEKKAEAYGSKIEIISNESNEGKQFKEMGGIAAILRYIVY